MEAPVRGHETVLGLLRKGVAIPNPLSLDIGPEVDPDRISGSGVTIYPGCRIYGANTVLSAGVKLGAEGPVTIDDCRLGPGVELRGGYFSKSVFLQKANMGLGAHVRAGSTLCGGGADSRLRLHLSLAKPGSLHDRSVIRRRCHAIPGMFRHA